MKYYTKFDQTGYGTGLTNIPPEDMTDVYEVLDTEIPNSGLRLKLDNGTVRPETEAEHAAELLRLKALNDIRVKRQQRDVLLDESDALVLPDRWASYTAQKQSALATYRQALRDFPQQTGFPNLDFPTVPT
jgi:hypothetical protein